MAVYHCDECHKDFDRGEEIHTFSGYGYLIGYCEECCPRYYDGCACLHWHKIDMPSRPHVPVKQDRSNES